MVDRIPFTITRKDQLLIASLTHPYLPEHLVEAAANLNARIEKAFRAQEEAVAARLTKADPVVYGHEEAMRQVGRLETVVNYLRTGQQ